jgi:hypothetical protein
MNVVVEGPDNSGKTTLVGYIAPRLGLQVIKGEGPPIDIDEWAERFERDPKGYAIYDRHTAVSEPIYGRILRGVDFSSERPELITRFYSEPRLFIYCRNETWDLGNHVADHERDSSEHLSALAQKHPDICRAYDAWALKHAHVVYRIGDDMHTIGSIVRLHMTRCMTVGRRHVAPLGRERATRRGVAHPVVEGNSLNALDTTPAQDNVS